MAASFSMSAVFSNGPLLSVYGKWPIVLATAWVAWGFPWDPFKQLLNWMRDPVLALEAWFGGKGSPVKVLPRSLFGDLIMITLVYYKKFWLIEFPYCPSNDLQLSLSSFLRSISSPFSNDSPVLTANTGLIQSTHKFYPISPLQGDSWVPSSPLFYACPVWVYRL